VSSVVQLLRQEEIDLYVSASALRTLESCPRQWWYRYLQGLKPQDVSARLVLGGAVHKALAHLYMHLMAGDTEPSLDDLVGVAGASIVKTAASDPPVLFGDDESPEMLVQEAKRLLETFVEQGYRPAKVLAVEKPFSLPIIHPQTGEVLDFEEQVVGAIDLIAQEDDGTVAVVDHKVVARADPTKAARADNQMATYAMAARELLGVDNVTLRYQNLVKTKTAKVVMQDIQRNPNDEVEVVEAVASGLTLINVAVGHPDGKLLMGRRRSWMCKDCGWRRRCAQDRSFGDDVGVGREH
jgi:putative RecB family exonuclease